MKKLPFNYIKEVSVKGSKPVKLIKKSRKYVRLSFAITTTKENQFEVVG